MDWLSTGQAFESTQQPIVQGSEFTVDASPNPFNGTTTLRFQLPQAGNVKLQVFEVTGRPASPSLQGWYETGMHEIVFEGSRLPSGLYIYRLQSGGLEVSGKIMLIK